MDERFFIQDPERLENNFFNHEIQREYTANFSEKSKQIVQIASKKHRHAVKMKKKLQKLQSSKKPSSSNQQTSTDQRKGPSKTKSEAHNSKDDTTSSKNQSSSNEGQEGSRFEYEPVLTSILNEKKSVSSTKKKKNRA